MVIICSLHLHLSQLVCYQMISIKTLFSCLHDCLTHILPHKYIIKQRFSILPGVSSSHSVTCGPLWCALSKDIIPTKQFLLLLFVIFGFGSSVQQILLGFGVLRLTTYMPLSAQGLTLILCL